VNDDEEPLQPLYELDTGLPIERTLVEGVRDYTALQSEVDVLTQRLNAAADTTAAGLYIVGPSERHTLPKPGSPR
jgi:hypothetical protein